MFTQLQRWQHSRHLMKLAKKAERELALAKQQSMPHKLGSPASLLRYALRQKLQQHEGYSISASLATLIEVQKKQPSLLYLSYFVKADTLEITTSRLMFPDGFSMPFSVTNLDESDDNLMKIFDYVHTQATLVLESDDYSLAMSETGLSISRRQGS